MFFFVGSQSCRRKPHLIWTLLAPSTYIKAFPVQNRSPNPSYLHPRAAGHVLLWLEMSSLHVARTKPEMPRHLTATRTHSASATRPTRLPHRRRPARPIRSPRWARIRLTAPASHLMHQVHVNRWNLSHVRVRVRSVRAASSHNTVETRLEGCTGACGSVGSRNGQRGKDRMHETNTNANEMHMMT